MQTLMNRLAGQAAAPELAWCAASWLALRQRMTRLRTDQRGMTTETVIITAGLAALAVAIVAIIATRVRDRANQIP